MIIEVPSMRRPRAGHACGWFKENNKYKILGEGSFNYQLFNG